MTNFDFGLDCSLLFPAWRWVSWRRYGGFCLINWEENGEYSGHDKIRQWFNNYIQVMKSSVKYLRHKITCPLIKVDGDDATAFSYLDVDAAAKDANQVIKTVCRYEDKITKEKRQMD